MKRYKMEDEKIKEVIQNTFNAVALEYDTNKQFVISALKMVQIISELKDETKKYNILDLSAGTGNISIELAKKYPNSKVYAVDISSEMLKIAHEKAKKENISNIIFSVQDVEKLEYEDIKFDIVTCGYGLFFYPNRKKVLKDISSRLNLDGVFVFSTFTQKAFQPYSKMFLDLLNQEYRIRPPENIENNLLDSKEEITAFLNTTSNISYEINEFEIRYPMLVEECWELFNTTGYQGLLKQLKDNYEDFKMKYIDSLKEVSKENKIDFNADSYISLVHLKS